MVIEEKPIDKRINDLKLCVIVPTYNNAGTLAAVINDILNYTNNVIIINDGSNENTTEVLENFNFLHRVTYKENKGKGYALKCGFDMAKGLGFRYVISMDADGQHFASDIRNFVDVIEKNPGAFISGQRITE
ncbi:MAG: glycosyltransferase family 2 protein [Tannerella sp.]|jgi:glycosyltransferase involved in cell wall biosynthesis|nr:glycosyltransferase family 2 protein [Tannerella sp.]